MTDISSSIMAFAGGGHEFTVLALVFAGILIAVFGIDGLFAPPDPLKRRLSVRPSDRPVQAPLALRRADDRGAGSLNRFIAPIDPRERRHLQRQLVRAGFRGDQTVMSYYLIRTILGLLLPLPLVLGSLAVSASAGTAEARLPILNLDMTTSMMLASLMLLIGFYGPSLWLRRRIAVRERGIRDGFPHALDMMQVAIEAGLGFDSALARVAHELKNAHPALAEEFVIVGLELRAGKAREQVLADLADRTQVDAIAVFTKAILQSIAFGTSIAATLQVYAQEMRHKRMLAAEERANQLPVKMSVVMVVFLLPTIFLMALSPVLIRLVRMFSTNVFPIG